MEVTMVVSQDNVLELSARMEFNGTEDVVNVFQFIKTDAGSITDSEAVDDVLDVLEGLYTFIIALYSVLLVFRDVRVFNRTTQELLGVHLWPTLVAGLQAQNATAPGVCAVVNFSTIVPKVSLRKYFGVLTEASVGPAGAFGVGTTSAVALMGAFLLEEHIEAAANWQYGYFSPKTLSFVVPNGSSNDSIPGYQRRRKHGRGS
jgi:hypothetical protein